MNPRLRTFVSGLGVLTIALFGSVASPFWSASPPPTEKQVELPDTLAGRRAAAFFEAFNSGDDDRMRDFEREYRAKSALKKRSIEDRIQQFHQLADRWGTLTPLRVMDASDYEISMLVRVSREDAVFEFRFQPEDEPPHGLVGLHIIGPVDPVDAEGSAQPIDDQTCNDTIASVAKALKEAYVYPEVGEQMAEALARYQAEGRYKGIAGAGELAHKLTTDLRAICNDLHLAIRPGRPGAGCSMIRSHHPPEEGGCNNYGFRKVELLPGNVGYIKFDVFDGSKEAQEAAAEALASVAECDALIFDLRDNGGGSPEMIQFISSYLFDEPTHLNSFYDRLSNKTSETWTLQEIPGRRFAADLPVYVLTSSYTGSAAEEFTYNLKHLKRATIMGETTGGAAHPVIERVINDRFRMLVPYARAENPITKTNWEGVGVIPHIKVSAANVLNAAREDAAKKISALQSRRG